MNDHYDPMPGEMTEAQYEQLMELRREAIADFEYEQEVAADAYAEEEHWAMLAQRAEEELGYRKELHWQQLLARAENGEFALDIIIALIRGD